VYEDPFICEQKLYKGPRKWAFFNALHLPFRFRGDFAVLLMKNTNGGTNQSMKVNFLVLLRVSFKGIVCQQGPWHLRSVSSLHTHLPYEEPAPTIKNIDSAGKVLLVKNTQQRQTNLKHQG
jgi:hypothetical protein